VGSETGASTFDSSHWLMAVTAGGIVCPLSALRNQKCALQTFGAAWAVAWALTYLSPESFAVFAGATVLRSPKRTSSSS
jgi:hypothetical protein